MDTKIQSDLWTKEDIKLRTENKTHWAQLKIGKQRTTGEQYLDILIGKKGENRKDGGMHFEIKLNQQIHYLDSRNITHKIKREVVSKNKGFLESKEQVINQNLTPLNDLNFSLNLDGSTGEVTITKFEFKKK